MKKAAKHTSKAAMIAVKDRAIVLSAHDHFLPDGFAGASMDGIAKSAGVSLKTIYSHFENKIRNVPKILLSSRARGFMPVYATGGSLASASAELR